MVNYGFWCGFLWIKYHNIIITEEKIQEIAIVSLFNGIQAKNTTIAWENYKDTRNKADECIFLIK